MKNNQIKFGILSIPERLRQLVLLTGAVCLLLSCNAPRKNKAGLPAEPLSFFVLGDWGMKGDFFQLPVAAQMIEQSKKQAPSFILTVGDNFYNDGSVKSITDDHWQQSYENVYKELTKKYPWYVAIGNHDYQGSVQAQINYHSINPNWILPDRYYTFTKQTPDNQTVRFVVIDTDPYIASYYSSPKYRDSLLLQDTMKQTRWLDSVLNDSPEKWKIVVGHHPIYCVGGKAEDLKEMMGTILPILEKHGVQVYICGHDHVFQYHLPAGSKTGFIISGTGAKPIREAKKEAYTLFSSIDPGFTICSIQGDLLSFNFIDTTGNILYSNKIRRDR